MSEQTCGAQHHFVGECRFHLATFIDDFCISTVGEYRDANGELRTIGLNRYYETFVFKTDGDWSEKAAGGDAYAHPDIADWSEIRSEAAMTAAEAVRTHEMVVAEYR